MKKLLAKFIPLAYGQFLNISAVLAPKFTGEKAFNIFCKIRKGRVQPEQESFLVTAKHDIEEVSNHELQSYRWEGRKETVLLVHGWESNTFRWRNLIKKLKEVDYNIIGFDAPAHGYSTGKILYLPLYEEAVHHMVKKYDPKYVIGHSMGGMTLIYNEYKNSNPNVAKMVIIGAPSEFHEIMTGYQDLLKFSDRVLLVLDNYIYGRFGFHIREFSASKFARTNTKKGLLFHDQLDAIAPYHASVAVHKNWKDSKLITTEGLGHSMHQEEINNQIIDFLES